MSRRLVLLPAEEIRELPDREATSVEDAVVTNLEVARLRRALRTLPPLERVVVELRWGLNGGEQLSIRQAAARLRMSVGRVFYLQNNALVHLRAEYGLGESEILSEAA